MSASALAAIFGTSFLVSLSGALSPGPLTTLAVREGVQRGFWSGPALAAGHGVIELSLVIGLALGLNQVLDNDTVAAAVALVGGIFLLWLGLQVIITAPRQELRIQRDPVDSPPANSGRERRGLLAAGPAPSLRAAPGLVLAGMAVSVSNPFWFVWWATIGAAYIVESLEQGAAGVAVFYGAHFMTDLGWLSLIALALASGRRIMSRSVYQGILVACGVFLLALAGWFLASGFGYIF